MTNVLRLAKNDRGRDFVVGDIHFKTIDLHKGLHALDFDKQVDRVIAVGDLIDRGPGVLDGLKLLGEPWFFTVQGNHEWMLIDAYRRDPQARYASHGAGWWSTIADESKPMIIEKLESLPVVIEIECAQGIVGVVHADVPSGMLWGEFVGNVENPQIEEIALWGRERIIKHHREVVIGAWRVCVGHTWIPSPLRLGNVLALDCTGGGDGPLAIYCVQEDTIYVDGRSVSLDAVGLVTEQLRKLEITLGELKTAVHGNKLIESQGLSLEAETLIKQARSTWLPLMSEIDESQRFVNALHGLSLLTEDRRAAKLEQLKARYVGMQMGDLLSRLFH